MGNRDKPKRRKGVKNAFTLLGRGRRADIDSTSSQTSSVCVFFLKTSYFEISENTVGCKDKFFNATENV